MALTPLSKPALVPEYTMDDLREQLGKQDASIQGIRGDVNLQAGALQRIEKFMKDLVAVMGEESEDGSGGFKGTGLVGRMRRNEAEVKRLIALYHRWIAFGAGFSACLMTAIAAIWWVIGDKVAVVLKGHP